MQQQIIRDIEIEKFITHRTREELHGTHLKRAHGKVKAEFRQRKAASAANAFLRVHFRVLWGFLARSGLVNLNKKNGVL